MCIDDDAMVTFKWFNFCFLDLTDSKWFYVSSMSINCLFHHHIFLWWIIFLYNTKFFSHMRKFSHMTLLEARKWHSNLLSFTFFFLLVLKKKRKTSYTFLVSVKTNVIDSDMTNMCERSGTHIFLIFFFVLNYIQRYIYFMDLLTWQMLLFIFFFRVNY